MKLVSAQIINPELVPEQVAVLAEAYERGKVVIGGRQAGRTWAAKIALVKPTTPQKELSK